MSFFSCFLFIQIILIKTMKLLLQKCEIDLFTLFNTANLLFGTLWFSDYVKFICIVAIMNNRMIVRFAVLTNEKITVELNDTALFDRNC